MQRLWKSEQADGTYRNPVLCGDYSDPDVIRVGEDYYMIASSFTYVPGVPVLHSKDLVNWELINYCIKELPFDRYSQPVHGAGTWAPSIRYEKGIFYVFIPMPDEGIFVVTAEDPYGEWSKPHCIKAARGWIDPCPFWDEDGRAYMVFAYAKSRCGIKHRLSICEMDPKARRLLSEPRLLYDGVQTNPTLEGPKVYRRNGWYYVFAPAGGVEQGWQTVLRSRNIYGPYEYRIVLHQGNTAINGPHQGAWVDTQEGENWFFHFRDMGPYGRVLYLEPVTWQQDWPFIGVEQNGDGIGEPVEVWSVPKAGKCAGKQSDGDFSSAALLHWQWQANPQKAWYSLTARPGCLRLYTVSNPARKENLLWYAGNACTQLLQALSFDVTVHVELSAREVGDLAGIGMIGHTYSYLALEKTAQGQVLRLYKGQVLEIQGPGKAEENIVWEAPWTEREIFLRISLRSQVPEQTSPSLISGAYRYSYFARGQRSREIPIDFPLVKATWTGAKFTLIALNRENRISGGYADFSQMRFT